MVQMIKKLYRENLIDLQQAIELLLLLEQEEKLQIRVQDSYKDQNHVRVIS